ncbi:MAG: polysaccharide biosynthesis/export family protein [Gammaproteobacteria bacterium]
MISQLGYRCRGFLVNNVQKSLLSFLALLLCASLSPSAMAAEGSAPGRTPPSDYRIGPEDMLEISVWREEDLQRQVLVRPDGKISFPLAGDIQAAGRTTDQVQQDISQKLQRYIPEPVVTVTVATVGGNKIYVIGQVNNPGAYVIGRYVDVLQALTVAGGLTPFASENKIKVLRREGGQEIVLPFEYADVKKGKNLEQNVILQGGDTVVVP